MHVANGHCWRKGAREHGRWNDACDHAINPIVLSSGMQLPKGALQDPRFSGKSAEEIYGALSQEAKQKQPQPQANAQPKPDGQSSGPDGKGAGGQPRDKRGEPQQQATGQPTCPTEVRPWVRNTNRVAGEKEFLVIGGRPTPSRGAVR
jgi:hypothetical protein